MKIATIIARSLLGLIFVTFGLNMFLNFIPMPPPPEGPAREFMTALSLCRGSIASRRGPHPVKRALDTVGSNAAGTCHCEYRLLPRPDGTCRIADGACSFVPRPVPALALSRTFHGSREKRRSGTLTIFPPGSCDGKRTS